MIIKPVSRLVQELDATSITVIGNPCADGLGVDALRLFHAGLSGAEGDVIIVPGDVSPQGHDPFYRSVSTFIERTAPVPVHVMRGNHDGPDFDKYFGHSNRAILSEHFVLIMLDNSHRKFAPDTLSFLRETLAIMDSHNVVVAFHYPPPNRVSGKSLTGDEWKEFEDAVGVWRNRISLLLCGHDHSYYEDDIDGLRLIVTGCGGAGIGGGLDRVAPIGSLAVEIAFNNEGDPQVTRRVISDRHIERSQDVRTVLSKIYRSASQYHVSMMLWGEEAEHSRLPELARLYYAVSESFLTQARIMRRLKEPNPAIRFSLDLALLADTEGHSDQEILALLERANDEVSSRALMSVARTEMGLKSLLAAAQRHLEQADDLEPARYFLCTSCAMLFVKDEPPAYCPECGAPESTMREV